MENVIVDSIKRIAERTVDNRRDISQKNKQRRIGFVDLYGEEYMRQGALDAPATFYISISPDLIYYERFEFKLIVEPFETAISSSGISPATVEVKNTTLTRRNGYVTQATHTHDTEPHTHSVVAGVTYTAPAQSGYRIFIADIDVTPYLMAQHDGAWIDGAGIYPDEKLGSEEDVYDILQVASDMMAEGKETLVDALLKPGFKKVEITADAPFRCTLVNYLKYSHMNR